MPARKPRFELTGIERRQLLKTLKGKGEAGRPTKLTEEMAEGIIGLVRVGNYIETAAAYHGVEKKYLYEWIKSGARAIDKLEKGERITLNEQIYMGFRNALMEAEARAQVGGLGLVTRMAINSNFQAASWRLERRWPKLFGRHETHELTGPDGGPLQLRAKELADAGKLDKVIDELMGRIADRKAGVE